MQPKFVPRPDFAGDTHLEGAQNALLVAASDTDGGFSLTRSRIEPGTGARRHVHSREDELFFVLSGTVTGHVGDDAHELGAGDCLFLPRDVPHSMENKGDEPAEVLMLLQPGGLEKFFEEMARLRREDASDDALEELAASYGIRFLDD